MDKALTALLSNEVILGYIIAAMGAIYAWLKNVLILKMSA